jgi:hypothetical protein
MNSALRALERAINLVIIQGVSLSPSAHSARGQGDVPRNVAEVNSLRCHVVLGLCFTPIDS